MFDEIKVAMMQLFNDRLESGVREMHGLSQANRSLAGSQKPAYEENMARPAGFLGFSRGSQSIS